MKVQIGKNRFSGDDSIYIKFFVNVLRFFFFFFFCPVGWGCIIHRLLLYKGIRPPTHTHAHKECPAYDTKQSDGEVPVILDLLEMLSTYSLSFLYGPLWSAVVPPDRVLSMGQIKVEPVIMLN